MRSDLTRKDGEKAQKVSVTAHEYSNKCLLPGNFHKREFRLNVAWKLLILAKEREDWEEEQRKIQILFRCLVALAAFFNFANSAAATTCDVIILWLRQLRESEKPLKMSEVSLLRLKQVQDEEKLSEEVGKRSLNNFEFKFHGWLLITQDLENKFLIVTAGERTRWKKFFQEAQLTKLSSNTFSW